MGFHVASSLPQVRAKHERTLNQDMVARTDGPQNEAKAVTKPRCSPPSVSEAKGFSFEGRDGRSLNENAGKERGVERVL